MIENKSGENFDFLLERKLKEEDKRLHENFTNCIFAINYLLANYKKVFPFFTNHTIDHSEQVLLYCNILAGNDIVSKLNKDEVYILLIGAVLHDVGMGISEKNFYEMSKNIPGLTKYIETHQGQSVAEYIRVFHHDFSAQYIYKYSDLFEIPSKEYAYCIAQVAKGHRKYSLLDENEYPSNYLLPNGNIVHLPYLAALVKLADEMDITSERNLLFDYDSFDEKISAKQIMCYKCHAALNRLEIYKDSLVFHYSTLEEDVGHEIINVADKLETIFEEYKTVINQRTNFNSRIEKVVFIKENN